jgi:hypothetical protein
MRSKPRCTRRSRPAPDAGAAGEERAGSASGSASRASSAEFTSLAQNGVCPRTAGVGPTGGELVTDRYERPAIIQRHRRLLDLSARSIDPRGSGETNAEQDVDMKRLNVGAGGGNRTRTRSLGSFQATTTSRPRSAGSSSFADVHQGVCGDRLAWRFKAAGGAGLIRAGLGMGRADGF